MTLPARTPSSPSAPLLPWPRMTRPSGSTPGAQVGAAAVVLEAGDLQRRPVAEVGLDRDVADQPRPGVADGLEVDEAEALDPLLAELVAVAEQLIAAADREHDGAVVDRGRDRLALGLTHVRGDQLLVAVLAAADVEQVVRAGSKLSPGPTSACSKSIPRHSQRRRKKSMLPRSA